MTPQTKFGEEYYNGLWATVHRHDYCHELASRLVREHGKCRILDIGTGCGFLVHLLRGMGCDAWGLDVSTYATQNTCAPGFVLCGSVTDIPFRDQRFDVVHSQGLWEYVAEDSIDAAFAECLRVGGLQRHTIDYLGSETGEEEFATAKPAAWWGRRLNPKILIACPVHERKEYAFQKWINNVKAFSYPHLEWLAVDTTEDSEFLRRYGNQVPMFHIGGGWGWQHVARAMNKIRELFLGGGYRYWFNIESDILPPANCVEVMLRHGAGADWISHCFPRRIGDHSRDFDQGIGCSMLSRNLMQNFQWPDTQDTPDCALWEQVRPLNRFTVSELWGFFQCQHLME